MSESWSWSTTRVVEYEWVVIIEYEWVMDMSESWIYTYMYITEYEWVMDTSESWICIYIYILEYEWDMVYHPRDPFWYSDHTHKMSHVTLCVCKRTHLFFPLPFSMFKSHTQNESGHTVHMYESWSSFFPALLDVKVGHTHESCPTIHCKSTELFFFPCPSRC